MKKVTRISKCRYCSSPHIEPFLSLGDHPPSNSFCRVEEIVTEEAFPLEVAFCVDCYLVQLLDTVSPKLLFDDYHYLSSTSKALVRHYQELTGMLTKRFGITQGDIVLDIGCNDGIMLAAYSGDDVVKLGVEPSQVGEIAQRAGFEVLRDFFSPRVANQIIATSGFPKITTATNVFPHIADIEEFVAGVSMLLNGGGIFVLEASYLIDLIDQTLFDTIYHEHLCYLSLTPLISFMKRFELEIFDVERLAVGASGPAIRVFIQKSGVGKEAPSERVEKLLQEEKLWGVGVLDRYRGYSRQVEEIKQNCILVLEELKREGKRVAGYGAPAKGNTLLNYFEITPRLVEYVAETNEMKIGLVTPGSHIPIVSEEVFLSRMPDYALLLSWNYLDFFLQQSAYIKNGGKFIVPLPQVKIVPEV